MKRFKTAVMFVYVILIAVMIQVGIMTTIAQTRPLTLMFAWQQTMSQGLTGWRLYMSETPGVFTEQPILTILYNGNPLNEYTSETDILSPDGETHTYYFVLTAFDDAGPEPNESGYSNEISQVIDFEAPDIPFTLTVEIKPVQ